MPNIVSFPKAAADRTADVQECVDQMGNIITLMRLSMDETQHISARAYLVREIEKYHVSLNSILFPDE